MNFSTSIFFSYSLLIPIVLSLVRYRTIDPVYLPFILLLWAGLLNESAGTVLALYGYPNIISYNLFCLAEALLVFWQFQRWRLFSLRYPILPWLAICCCFSTELFIKGSSTFCSYFIVCYSFVFSLLSITMINKTVFSECTTLLQHPAFIISAGFLLYFAFSAITESFWIFGIEQSASFRLRIYDLHNYVNLFTNLVFGFAIVWMRLKRESILSA